MYMYVCIWGSDRLSKTPSSDLMDHLTASRPKKLAPLVRDRSLFIAWGGSEYFCCHIGAFT